MQARTQKHTHTLPKATERVETKEAAIPARRGPSSPTEAVLSNIYQVSSSLVHISSVSVLLEWLQTGLSNLCRVSGQKHGFEPHPPRLASALPILVQVSAKSLQHPLEQQSWHHPHRQRCPC